MSHAQGKAPTVEALFDSARSALRFAMNHKVAMPRPVMNRMMSETDLKRIKLDDGSRMTITTRRHNPAADQLRGLEGAATAGMILQHFARLDEHHRSVLTALAVPSRDPCGCNSPCCSLWRPNQQWGHAVLALVSYMRDEAQLSKIKGKKGMSTAPTMRLALVESYLQPERQLDTASLAEACECTTVTVHNHRKLIHGLLEEMETAAWSELDAYLTDAGIVGNVY